MSTLPTCTVEKDGVESVINQDQLGLYIEDGWTEKPKEGDRVVKVSDEIGADDEVGGDDPPAENPDTPPPE